MNPKIFASLLIASILFMSFPWEAYAISQSFQDEICQDASDEAKGSIKRLAPPKNPTSVQSRQYYEGANFHRVQAEQLCRDASPKAQNINIEGIASAAVGILASLTQTYGDVNRFADMCRGFLDDKTEDCDEEDVKEFDSECEEFLNERIGECGEKDVQDFLEACDTFITDRRSYCGKEKTEALLNQFAGECTVLFTQEFPACADIEEETNLVDEYVGQCKEFVDEGRDFCFDLLYDAQGVVVDIQKKVVDIGIDAAWKIPFGVLREAALIAVKVADRISWRRIQGEFTKRYKKINDAHDELSRICEPDTLIRKSSRDGFPATLKSIVTKMLTACIGSFF